MSVRPANPLQGAGMAEICSANKRNYYQLCRSDIRETVSGNGFAGQTHCNVWTPPEGDNSLPGNSGTDIPMLRHSKYRTDDT